MNITETKSNTPEGKSDIAAAVWPGVLAGMTLPELAELLDRLPLEKKPPSYRAKQVFSWIAKGVQNVNGMTNLPQSLIGALEGRYTVRGSSVQKKITGKDRTVKLVLKLSDGELTETVLLPSAPKRSPENSIPAESSFPAEGHYTACLSTQIGCPIGCVFCKTGTMGFIRNLECSEIIEQFLFLSDELAGLSGETRREGRISNLVIMGMGEPLLNFDTLKKALGIFCDPAGHGISKRKITVSTAGIYGKITDIAENGPVTELAVSVASARDSLRNALMPGTSAYPLSQLKEALIIFQKKTGRQITIETVLLGGINTGTADAQALTGFVKNLDAVINIIPWNPVQELYFDGRKLMQPEPGEVKGFINTLKKSGLTVTQRFRRGRGISGACGQLGADR